MLVKIKLNERCLEDGKNNLKTFSYKLFLEFCIHMHHTYWYILNYKSTDSNEYSYCLKLNNTNVYSNIRLQR